MAYQAPLNGGRINASIGGNSTSAGGGYQLVSTGTLLLAGGNNVTLSQNANSISINAGGGGTMSMYALGNTTQNSSATMDVRSVSLNGIGGLTAGYSNGSVQLSAPVVSSVSATGALSISANGNTVSMGVPAVSMGMSNIGNTSGTSGTASNQLIFAGGNNVTLSQSTGAGGNTLTISAANQSNQSLGFYASGNTTGQSSSSTFDARTVSFSAAGGLSAGFSGSALQLSAPAQSSLSATGIFSISANGSTISMGAPAYSAGISTNGNTSGTTGFATNQLLLAGGNNITLSQSTGAGGNTLTISAANQSNQNMSLYALGNTTQNSSTLLNASNLSFNGLGAATVGYSNGSIQVSAPVQTNQTANFYVSSNSTQLSSTAGIDLRSVTFQGAGIASVGVSQGKVLVSVPGGGAGGVALANSQTTFTSGTVNLLEGGGAVTIASSAGGQSYKISVPTVSSLSATGAVSISNNGGTISIGAPAFSAGISNIGNTAGTSGTASNQVIFAGGNNVTLSQSTGAGGNTITVSAANQTVQTQNLHNLTLAGNSTSAGAGYVQVSSGTLTLAGGNNITLSQNGNAVTVSGASQTNQTIGGYAAGGTMGQSSSSTIDARSLSFYGSGAASVGYSNGSVVISAPNAAAGNVTFSAGANSAGLASIVFSNSNGVSFGLNGSTITASAAGGGGGVNIAASNTTFTSGTVVMSNNGGALTISSGNQSVLFSVPATSSLAVTGGLSASTNGSTISLGVPGLMSNWLHNSAAFYSSTTGNMINGTASVARMLIPAHISFTRVDIPVSVSLTSSAAANTAAMALSAVGVIYSRNGSTLNPIIGQSSTTTYSYASNTGVYSSLSGARLLSFNLATSLSAGEYYFGLQLSSATSSVGTATTNLGWTVAPVYGTSYSAAPWSDISAAPSQTVHLLQPLQGINSVMVTNTTMTMQQSQISQSGGTSGGLRGNFIVNFRNN